LPLQIGSCHCPRKSACLSYASWTFASAAAVPAVYVLAYGGCAALKPECRFATRWAFALGEVALLKSGIAARF